ncbi:MAG: TM0106 family RecB-like putative nuclease [Alphaproteobacteria bacterium]|nr:TM0106 family RecB-like putative nuclease [Alphaproteobacteria bacterium]
MAAVECRTIQLIKISELHSATRNARTHSKRQIKQIADSIRCFGFMNPVLIDDKSQIVAGHGRVAAAQSLGIPEIPCLRLGDMTDLDSPIFVAGLARNQMLKLEAAGITTLAGLAGLKPEYSISGISPEVVAKLVSQARLQKAVASGEKHSVEVLPVHAGRGFALLPVPAPGDLFFDMEGDPLYPEGLEYLFGLYGQLNESQEPVYQAIWGHDRAAEKAAFEEFMRLLVGHFQRFPTAHIYHYAQYEESALKRLAMRYATMEAELDQMLRDQRFVDLFRVTRQALRASTESYSLKDLEKIYWDGRTGEVTNAADSIVEYEKWLVTADQSILDAIAHYNEDDCISTAKLRDWLVSLRPAGADYGLAAPKVELDEEAAQRAADREARDRLKHELAARVRNSKAGDERVRTLVAELLWFHQRSQKPQWWAMFDRQTWSDDELVDDPESLGGLTLDPQKPVEIVKKSYRATYRFPPQDTKLRPSVSPTISATCEYAGTIEAVEPDEGIVVLKRGIAKGDFPPNCSLSPGAPLDQKVLAEAVGAFASRFAVGNLANDQAIMDFLLRAPPKLRGRKAIAPVIEGADLLAGSVAAVRALDQSTLFIQGPPGTGKTYTTSHAILALLKEGKRVAVSSNSHKAINNVLSAVEDRARNAKFSFVGAKKGSRSDPETAFDGTFIETAQKTADIDERHRLVGGTAFHFAVDDTPYDYLFVDEAGQVSLGNLIAMARCARNLVLVGDQMQLAQPIQGVHPGETGLSCLDYLLQNEATVSPERGILLNVSYRMHPDVCQLISDAIYDGRLTANAKTSLRYLELGPKSHPALKPAGVSFLTLDHEGCTQSSAEEADAIVKLVANLLKQKLHEQDGKTRAITLADILIVAPFNMQVNRLRRALPTSARIGTVDKFQGQEAAVVIVSMTTSDGNDAPRGTDFLFSRNRFNVAISRAQCLAIVVQSGKLQDVSFGSIDDLVRLNLFARAEAVAKDANRTGAMVQ